MALQNDWRRTLLTGAPLEWQLTNPQRLALGLAPVEPHWVQARCEGNV